MIWRFEHMPHRTYPNGRALPIDTTDPVAEHEEFTTRPAWLPTGIDWPRVFVWFVAPPALWGAIIGGVGVLAGWW